MTARAMTEFEKFEIDMEYAEDYFENGASFGCQTPIHEARAWMYRARGRIDSITNVSEHAKAFIRWSKFAEKMNSI